MSQHGKKHLAALAKVDITKFTTRTSARHWSKLPAYAQFDATVEVHMRMGLDPRQAGPDGARLGRTAEWPG